MKQTALILALVILLGGILFFFQRTKHRDRTDADNKARAVHEATITATEQSKGHPARSMEPAVPPPQNQRPPASPLPELPDFTGVKDAIPNEYVLSFYDSRDQAAFAALARKLGIRVLDTMPVGHALRISVQDRALLRTLLAKGPRPIDWMPNTYVRIPEREENAPLAPKTGYTAFGGNALEWLGIRDNATWGSGITVAVLDSGIASVASLDGVNIDHLDLVGQTGGGNMHGTAVASIIAGADTAVRGVAPGVDLLSVRVITDEGGGNAFTLAKGITEAVDRGAELLCICLASRGGNAVLETAIQYATERDVTIVAAAGNDALSGVSYPARYAPVIAVPAVDAKGEHLYFSNRGTELDVAAPGAGVAASRSEGDAILFSGTSAAAPFVAGAVAALLAEEPELEPDAIAELLTRYSNDTGAPGDDESFGSGILDVGRLMDRDVGGVYDMAAMAPHIDYDETDAIVRIAVAAQNRGTEIIGEVALDIAWGNSAETHAFRNVGVGQTVSHSITLPYDAFPPEGLDLQTAALPIGVTDAIPQNNALNTRITIAE